MAFDLLETLEMSIGSVELEEDLPNAEEVGSWFVLAFRSRWMRFKNRPSQS